MTLRLSHAPLLLTLLGTAAFAADVYRSTAPDGTVSYSDRPQGADAQFVQSTTPTAPRARAGAPAAPGAQPANPGAATAPEAAASPQELPPGPSALELREQRQKNCEIARERLDRYTLSR